MPAPSTARRPTTPLGRRQLRPVVVLAAAASLTAQVNPVSAATLGSPTSYRVATVQNPVLQRTEVVRWNPCAVIGYRVNAALGGRQALADVQTAVARLSSASGLQFRYLGSTTYVPTAGRAPLPGAPLVIAWAKPGTTSHLSTGEVGHGGWRATTTATGRYRITSGYVVVRAGAPLALGFGPGVTRGRVLMHELGHAVGLDHVTDPVMTMHTTLSGRSPSAVYQAGDVTGLRKVGRPAGCIS